MRLPGFRHLALWLGLGAALAAAEPNLAQVTLQLKWQHQFQFAGYYAADAKGYYREAGLQVDLLEAKPGLDTVKEVVSGRAQYGVGNSALVLSRQQGQPVVVLAAVFQHSPLVLIAKAGTAITSVHDLVGKRLMIEDHADELVAYLRKEGVAGNAVTLVKHSFNPDDLISGKVDCISAYVTDESFFLEQAQQKYLEFSPRMGGIDFYGDNLFTSEQELKAHPARVKAFREASMKGWKYAMQHPEEVADLIMARYGERHGRAYLLYEAQKMTALIQPNLVEMGYMYSGRWQHITDTYAELGLLPAGYRLEGFQYDPEVGDRQNHRRMVVALGVVLALGGLFGGTTLVFLRLNFRLKAEVASRKEAELAIRREHAQAEGYLAVAEVILLALDAEGRVTMLNRKGYSVLGYAEGELLGRNWLEVCLPPEEAGAVNAVYRRVLAGDLDPVYFYENHILRRDGEQRLIAWHNTMLTDGDGRIVGTLSSGEDITERRRAEEQKSRLEAQLRQVRKMDSLGSLAGGVAHDMNNVLGAILGLASSNIEDQAPGTRAHRAFGTIIKAAERGGGMVKSLLSFARQSPAAVRDLDLNAILGEEASFLEHTTLAKVHLQLDLEPGLHAIRGDASALSSAVMNLCVNAVDAMPEHGRLILRSRNLPGLWVEIQVEDNGSGMPQEVLERALDPFFTTKPDGKGTGLGLSMVYSIVKAHLGQMEIHSEAGHGTTVRMRFPACEGVPVPALPPAPDPARPEAPLAILVVDDDELFQCSIQAILEGLGHAATQLNSGEEALAALEGGLEPAVVILDMNMPGLGGSGTLPPLRALRPGVPVILATGRANQAALTLAQTYPGVTLLPKPFSKLDLQRHLGLVTGK
jgi:PAS domain S-box-containing protein